MNTSSRRSVRLHPHLAPHLGDGHGRPQHRQPDRGRPGRQGGYRDLGQFRGADWPETQEAIRQLAKEFPLHQLLSQRAHEGAQFQVFAAPGGHGAVDLDLRLGRPAVPGRRRAVVQKLEAEDPSFLVMNCAILERDLTEREHSLSGLPTITSSASAN
ncbi:MAG: hypothetical protein WDN45_18970 [Caulobacteraceae bacterium]